MASLPYLFLVILLVRGATLPGWLDGLKFYLIPRWSDLRRFSVCMTFSPLFLFPTSICILTLYNKFIGVITTCTIDNDEGYCCFSEGMGDLVFNLSKNVLFSCICTYDGDNGRHNIQFVSNCFEIWSTCYVVVMNFYEDFIGIETQKLWQET